MLQENNASDVIITAVCSAISANIQDPDTAALVLTVAKYCIQLGIRPLKGTDFFEISPTPLSLIEEDTAFTATRDATEFFAAKLQRILQKTFLSEYFLLASTSRGDVTVALNLPALMPRPSPMIKSLLPNVHWPSTGMHTNNDVPVLTDMYSTLNSSNMSARQHSVVSQLRQTPKRNAEYFLLDQTTDGIHGHPHSATSSAPAAASPAMTTTTQHQVS